MGIKNCSTYYLYICYYILFTTSPLIILICKIISFGIIYDTRSANINTKLCTTKFFLIFFCFMIEYQYVLADITRRIREIRRSKKLTVQEVAYRCNIERSNLSRIEAGKTNITIKTLCLICNALNIKLTDIIK